MKKATQVLCNGHILSMDPFNRVFPAIALHGDRILALGSTKEMQALAGSDTEIIDLGGKTVLPGFCDAHGHFCMYAEFSTRVNLNSPPVADCRDIPQALQLLAQRASQTALGQWVSGYGFDDTMIADQRFPTRQELDSACPNHPLCIMHISGHLAVLNSAALTLAGYDKDTPDPQGGVIRHEADGSPSGVLEETAMYMARNAMPALSCEEMMTAIETVSQEYLRKGITSAVEAAAMRQTYITALRKSAQTGRLPLRVTYNPMMYIYDEAEEIDFPTPLLRRGGVKLLQDGSIQGFTAYLSAPYHTPFKGDAAWRGYPCFPREKLFSIIATHHKAGHQCVIHTNGDAAIDDVLDAIEAAQKEHPVADPRFLLIHAQTVREDQLDRFRALGVTPSFFTPHVYYWGDRHASLFLGPERAARQNPMRSALERGLVISSHCDVPVVPVDPFLSIWACVNRRSSTGALIGAEQRISVMDALRAHTINPAWQNFEENDRGSLEVGKFADLAVLDTDPLRCPVEALRDIRVTMTMLGGQIVYSA